MARPDRTSAYDRPGGYDAVEPAGRRDELFYTFHPDSMAQQGNKPRARLAAVTRKVDRDEMPPPDTPVAATPVVDSPGRAQTIEILAGAKTAEKYAKKGSKWLPKLAPGLKVAGRTLGRVAAPLAAADVLYTMMTGLDDRDPIWPDPQADFKRANEQLKEQAARGFDPTGINKPRVGPDMQAAYRRAHAMGKKRAAAAATPTTHPLMDKAAKYMPRAFAQAGATAGYGSYQEIERRYGPMMSSIMRDVQARVTPTMSDDEVRGLLKGGVNDFVGRLEKMGRRSRQTGNVGGVAAPME